MAARRVTLRDAHSAGAANAALRGLARGRGAGRGRGRGSRESDYGSWQKSGWTKSEGSNWTRQSEGGSSSWKDRSWNSWDDSEAAQTKDWSRSRGSASASDRKDESPGRAPKVVLRPAAPASRSSGVGRTSIEASTAHSSRFPEKAGITESGGLGVVLEENRNASKSDSTVADKVLTRDRLQAARAKRDAKRASLVRAGARQQPLLEVGSRQRLSARRRDSEEALEDSVILPKQISNRTSKSLTIEEQPGETDEPTEQNESRTRQRQPAAAARRILGQRAVARPPPARRLGQRAAPLREVDSGEEQRSCADDCAESDAGKASSSRPPLKKTFSDLPNDAERARKAKGEMTSLQQKPRPRVMLRRPVPAKAGADGKDAEKVLRKPVLKASKVIREARKREAGGPRRILNSVFEQRKRPLGIANLLRTALDQTHQGTTPRRQGNSGPLTAVVKSSGPRNALGKKAEAESAMVEDDVKDVLEEQPSLERAADDDDAPNDDNIRNVRFDEKDVGEDRERGVKDRERGATKGAVDSERETQHRRRKSSHQGDAGVSRRRKATLKRRSPSGAESRVKRRRTGSKEQIEEKEDAAHLIEDVARAESRNSHETQPLDTVRDDVRYGALSKGESVTVSSKHEVAAEEEKLPQRRVHIEKTDLDRGSLQQVSSPGRSRQDEMQSKPIEDDSKLDGAIADQESQTQQRRVVQDYTPHYIEGDRVEFWSQTHKCYTRTRVIQVNKEGDVILSCKKKAWIPRNEHAELIRPCESTRERMSKLPVPEAETLEERRRTEHSHDDLPRRPSDALEQKESLSRVDSRGRDAPRKRDVSERRSPSHSATRSRSAGRRETMKPSDVVDSRLPQTGGSTHLAQADMKETSRKEQIDAEADPQPPLAHEPTQKDRGNERDDSRGVGAATVAAQLEEDVSEKTSSARKRQDEADGIARKVEAIDAAKSAPQPTMSAEAEPEADADSGSQNVTASDEHFYEKDERVEFWSQTHKQWTRTTVKDVRADGEVLLACKSAWISKAEQAAKMRPILVDPTAAPSVAPKGARAKAAPVASHIAVPNKDDSAKSQSMAAVASGHDKERERSPSEDAKKKQRVAEAAMAIFASGKTPAEQKRSSSSSSSSSTHSVVNSDVAPGNLKEEKQDVKKEEPKNVADLLKDKADRRGQEARSPEERRSPPKRGLSLELDDGVFEGSEDKRKERKHREDGRKEEFCEAEAQPRPKSGAQSTSHRRRRQASSEPRESSPKHDKLGRQDEAQPKPKSVAHRKSHRRRREESSEPREDSPKHDKGNVDLGKKNDIAEAGPNHDNSDGKHRKGSPQMENAKRSKRDQSAKKDGSAERGDKKRENSRNSPEHRGRRSSPDRARRGSPERGKKHSSQDRKRGSPETGTKRGSPERGRRDERGEDRDKVDHRRSGGSPRRNSGSVRHRESDDRDRRDSGGHDRGRDNRNRGQRDDAKNTGRRDRSPLGRTGTRGGDPGSGRRGRSRDAKASDGKRNARSRSDRKAARQRDRSRR